MTTAYEYLAKKPGSTDMAIAGRSLRVYTLKRAYEMGGSAESLAADHDVPLPAVFEALAYAYEHTDDMEAIRLADEEAEGLSLDELPGDLRRIAEETIAGEKRKQERATRQARKARLGNPVS